MISAIPESDEDRLCTDDRGAIMVLGIFMCVFLVGALWYIVGIGDALIYHERMQEAADAVAFSSSVITARGMNIIVLLNLIMAAILAIRVAINVAKFGLIVVAGIFGAIGLIPFMEEFIAFAGVAIEGAELLQEVDNDLKQPIDTALIAIHGAAQVVKFATPLASFAGAQEIASKYSPIVRLPSLVFGATVGTAGTGPSGGGQGGSGQGSAGAGQSSGGSGIKIGLPVTDGTLHKLCDEAFKADSDLIKDVLPGKIGTIGGGAVGLVQGIADTLGVSDAFCELGGGGDPNAGLAQATQNVGDNACQSQSQTFCDDAQAAQTKLQQVQSQNGWVDGTAPDNASPSAISAVAAAQADADAKQAKCDAFDKCSSDASNDSSNKQKAALQAVQAKGTTQGVNGAKFPAMVDPKWHNGIRDAQIVAVVFSTSGNAFVNTAPKYEQIASGFFHDQTVTYTTPGKAIGGFDLSVLDPTQQSWAQGEFFYDCAGDWSTCNKTEEAMWNFHWRARLRLVNPDAFLPGIALKGLDLAMKGKIGADLAKYTAKWAAGGLNLQTAVQAITPVELSAALVKEPLTLH